MLSIKRILDRLILIELYIVILQTFVNPNREKYLFVNFGGTHERRTSFREISSATQSRPTSSNKIIIDSKLIGQSLPAMNIFRSKSEESRKSLFEELTNFFSIPGNEIPASLKPLELESWRSVQPEDKLLDLISFWYLAYPLSLLV